MDGKNTQNYTKKDLHDLTAKGKGEAPARQ